MRRLKVSLGSLALVSLVAVLAAGCGGSSKKAATTTTSSTTTTSANAKIAAEVPAAIKSKGTLTVATDATYAPNEFIGIERHRRSWAWTPTSPRRWSP